ncbi:MAG: ExbD/TolR family protein [Planctomycetota bacterium]|jgi:biopolymer transport protein ExbD
MRYASKQGADVARIEMTPMIDMTFQLIAFFMVVVNFSEADQNQKIRLPLSELAKPPEAAAKTPITVQLTHEDTVILGPDEIPMTQLFSRLLVEKQLVEREGGSAPEATIIIRADREAKHGEVQKVIRTCQDLGFQNFRLRARQESA